MRTKWLLTGLIFGGIVAGIVAGHLLHDPNFDITMSDDAHAHAATIGVFSFMGNTIFLGMLKMLIIPLITTSVIVGVSSVGDFRQLGKIGVATLIYYVATMMIAAVIGLILVTSIKPGHRITSDQLHQAQETYKSTDWIQENIEQGPQGIMGAVQHIIEQIIPENIVGAAAEGKALPVIFFSILFGIVLTMTGESGRRIAELFEGLFKVIMTMVHGIIWLTPIGVFGLMAWTIARIGLNVFADAIGTYMITVLTGLAIHGLVVLPLLCWLFGRCNPFRYLYQLRQVIMTALGTDSSSATLPVTMECVTQVAGVSKKSAGFVLPLGATINMDGTALYEAVAVVFLAQAYGIELSFSALILVAVTATFAAIGAAGIPSAGLVTMVIVVETVNGTLAGLEGSPSIPIEAIGLIVGVDRLLDMFRTAVNVWGDAVGAKIVDRIDGNG